MKPFPSGRPPLALPARATLLLVGTLLGACSSSQPHAHGPSVPLAPGRPPGAVALDPAEGQAIGFTYEAFLSPQQEPGEERDTPSLVPDTFKSTAPSLLRNERPSRGHGVIRFTKDLSRAYVDVKLENVKPEDIVMFHIHCGKPDMLGPILVDFGHSRSLKEATASGLFSVIVTNEDIEKTSASAHGIVGAFTVGCPINLGLPGKVKTVAGMQHIADLGEIYFNLHTRGQTFYGDIRGQLRRVTPAASATTPTPAATPTTATPAPAVAPAQPAGPAPSPATRPPEPPAAPPAAPR
jgi:hypothetical protein